MSIGSASCILWISRGRRWSVSEIGRRPWTFLRLHLGTRTQPFLSQRVDFEEWYSLSWPGYQISTLSTSFSLNTGLTLSHQCNFLWRAGVWLLRAAKNHFQGQSGVTVKTSLWLSQEAGTRIDQGADCPPAHLKSKMCWTSRDTGPSITDWLRPEMSSVITKQLFP